MSRWARLTWQAAEPEVLARELARRLGLAAPRAAGGASWLLPLGPDHLEVRPWLREGPADDPRAAGRLVFEPLEAEEVEDADETGEGARRAVGARMAPTSPDAALVLVGVGWSTVDLDRAEQELEVWLEPGPEPPSRPHVDEPHLGALGRVRSSPGLPGGRLVLLEPSTEGPAAASLARDGEGPCVLYLAPVGGLAGWLEGAAERDVRVTALRPGPLGPSARLLGPAAGPHLIVADVAIPAEDPRAATMPA